MEEPLQIQTHPASSARLLAWVPSAGTVTRFYHRAIWWDPQNWKAQNIPQKKDAGSHGLPLPPGRNAILTKILAPRIEWGPEWWVCVCQAPKTPGHWTGATEGSSSGNFLFKKWCQGTLGGPQGTDIVAAPGTDLGQNFSVSIRDQLRL